MVEHGIEHDADAARVSIVDERSERIEVAETMVDTKVVDRVVAMVGTCLEDGREVDRVRSHCGDVIQACADAGKIPAEKLSRVGSASQATTSGGFSDGSPLAKRSGKIW
jgi:hypothetical protein